MEKNYTGRQSWAGLSGDGCYHRVTCERVIDGLWFSCTLEQDQFAGGEKVLTWKSHWVGGCDVAAQEYRAASFDSNDVAAVFLGEIEGDQLIGIGWPRTHETALCLGCERPGENYLAERGFSGRRDLEPHRGVRLHPGGVRGDRLSGATPVRACGGTPGSPSTPPSPCRAA